MANAKEYFQCGEYLQTGAIVTSVGLIVVKNFDSFKILKNYRAENKTVIAYNLVIVISIISITVIAYNFVKCPLKCLAAKYFSFVFG